MSRRLAAALGLTLALAAPSGAEAKTRTYALVIGENRSLDPGVAPLEYADDDAAKSWELFSLHADKTALFALLDQETARLHPEAARAAELPERALIMARLARFEEEMAQDLANDDEPELFLIYAGHGDVDGGGEGYITLHDAKLTRDQLYREIIAPSKARFVHVLVDACKSYFLVKSRGRPWKDDSVPLDDDRPGAEAVKALLIEDALARYPRAGVIVATSGDQVTHEWSRYRGGILSYELRSALSGAADINRDGRVEYSEVRAFIAAANSRVRNAEVRLESFARAPALDRHRALIDLSRVSPEGAGRLLHFPIGLAGHFSIHDDRGVRYADVNKDASTAFDILVSSKRAYAIEKDELETAEIPAGSPFRVDMGDLRWARTTLAVRGALDQTFRQELFRVPYGRSFYDGFVVMSGDLAVQDQGAAGFGDERSWLAGGRLDVGYQLAASPLGDSGATHGAAIGFARGLGAVDLGALVEVGHGAGPAGEARALTRIALMADAGVGVHPGYGFGLRADLALGWQILSGSVMVRDVVLDGTDPRGLRAELGGAVSYQLWDALGLSLRGGAALDGLYSPVARSTRVQPFLQAGLVFEP